MTQRKGVGRKLMEYMFHNYPAHLSLDVSTDNTKAVNFYKRVGLEVEKLYITEKTNVEFVTFTTPLGFEYKPPVYVQVAQSAASTSTKSDDNDKEERKEEDDSFFKINAQQECVLNFETQQK